MIQRKDILSIPFLKKSVFTGSCQGMRYRLEKTEAEIEPAKEGEEAKTETRLKVFLWEGPYSFDVVPKEEKEAEEFSFSEEGICQAVDWLNDAWQRQPERWRRAKGNW